MSINVSVESFTANVDLPVQMRCRSSNFYVSKGEKAQLLFNFDHGILAVGYMETYDGGNNWNWIMQQHFGIRESKTGLQFFDGQCWKLFEKDIQEDYAQYVLEKEIK